MKKRGWLQKQLQSAADVVASLPPWMRVQEKSSAMEEKANYIVEAVLVKLSQVPKVGDTLEAMSTEDYDKLEDELYDLVLKNLGP